MKCIGRLFAFAGALSFIGSVLALRVHTVNLGDSLDGLESKIQHSDNGKIVVVHTDLKNSKQKIWLFRKRSIKEGSPIIYQNDVANYFSEPNDHGNLLAYFPSKGEMRDIKSHELLESGLAKNDIVIEDRNSLLYSKDQGNYCCTLENDKILTYEMPLHLSLYKENHLLLYSKTKTALLGIAETKSSKVFLWLHHNSNTYTKDLEIELNQVGQYELKYVSDDGKKALLYNKQSKMFSYYIVGSNQLNLCSLSLKKIPDKQAATIFNFGNADDFFTFSIGLRHYFGTIVEDKTLVYASPTINWQFSGNESLKPKYIYSSAHSKNLLCFCLEKNKISEIVTARNFLEYCAKSMYSVSGHLKYKVVKDVKILPDGTIVYLIYNPWNPEAQNQQVKTGILELVFVNLDGYNKKKRSEPVNSLAMHNNIKLNDSFDPIIQQDNDDDDSFAAILDLN